jgi:hypothetical protein
LDGLVGEAEEGLAAVAVEEHIQACCSGGVCCCEGAGYSRGGGELVCWGADFVAIERPLVVYVRGELD